jgi:Fe-S-cluster containining protein
MSLQEYDVCMECGGICCKYQPSKEVREDDEYQIEYWDARAQKKIKTKKGWVYLSEMRCPHFTDDNLCGIYENRPELCRNFPKKGTHKVWRYYCKLLDYRLGARENCLRVLKRGSR